MLYHMTGKQQNLTGQLRDLLTSAQDIAARLADTTSEPDSEPAPAAWPPELIPQRFVIRSRFHGPGEPVGDIGLGVKFPDGSAAVRWLKPRYGESWQRIEDMQAQFKRDSLETVWIDKPYA